MNKRDLMNLVLSESEIKNADVAIPIGIRKDLEQLGVSDFIIRNFVKLYDKDKAFGVLVNLIERHYLIYKGAEQLYQYLKEIELYIDVPIEIKKLLLEIEMKKHMLLTDLVTEKDQGSDESGVPLPGKALSEDISEMEYQAILLGKVEEMSAGELLRDPKIRAILSKELNSEIIEHWKEISERK